MMKRLMWTVSIPASCRPDGSHLRSDVRGRETERRASFPGKNHPSCYRTIRQMSHNVNGNSRGLGQTERRRSYWVRNSRLCSALLCSYCYETPQSTDVWPAETTALSKPTIQHNGLMRMRAFPLTLKTLPEMKIVSNTKMTTKTLYQILREDLFYWLTETFRKMKGSGFEHEERVTWEEAVPSSRCDWLIILSIWLKTRLLCSRKNKLNESNWEKKLKETNKKKKPFLSYEFRIASLKYKAANLNRKIRIVR